MHGAIGECGVVSIAVRVASPHVSLATAPASMPVAAEVRAEVFRKLRYTCSAGVAHNKTLAKLVRAAAVEVYGLEWWVTRGIILQGSAMNKPNRQTLFPVSAVQEFMCKLPLRKIKMLGGKLGKVGRYLHSRVVVVVVVCVCACQ